MKLVWEIQIYPVIKFPKYVAYQVRDIKKLEDSLSIPQTDCQAIEVGVGTW